MMTNNSLAATRQRLTEIASSIMTLNYNFPTVDSVDNESMNDQQRAAMQDKLDQAEALLDSVRKQLYDAQI